MANNTNGGGGGNTLLALIVGGLLVVVVGVFAFGWWPGTNEATVSLEAPSVAVDR